MYNIIEMKENEDGIPLYCGGKYPYCKMYNNLEATYLGWSRNIVNISETSNKTDAFDVYKFESEIGDIVYKKKSKDHNKLTDNIELHKYISGVKYSIKAVIGPQLDRDGKPFGNEKTIYRLINFNQLTRNPESCKVQNK